MEVIICSSKQEAELSTARLIAARIRANPKLLLGLATGRTPEGVYALLADMHKNAGLDFSLAHSVNLDEYVGLAPEHDQSYRYFMNKHLFSKVNIKLSNTHLPDGMAKDIPAECANFEAQIARLGGIDLQLLGIGSNGHIGFNEPGCSLASRTRIKTLTKETLDQNGPMFGDPKLMPRHALTMGVGTIMEAKEVLLIATGKGKAPVVKAMVEGAISAWVPASILQMHQRAVIVLDQDAASELQNGEYYKWVYANKPDWQKSF